MVWETCFQYSPEGLSSKILTLYYEYDAVYQIVQFPVVISQNKNYLNNDKNNL